MTYDDNVINPALEISAMLQFTDEACMRLRTFGVDPYSVLSSIRENAFEDIKDHLRPAFFARSEQHPAASLNEKNST